MNTLDKIKIMLAYLDGHKIVASGKDHSYTATYHISDSQEPRWNFAACDYAVLPKDLWGVACKETGKIGRLLYDNKEEAAAAAKTMNEICRGTPMTYYPFKITEEV